MREVSQHLTVSSCELTKCLVIKTFAWWLPPRNTDECIMMVGLQSLVVCYPQSLAPFLSVTCGTCKLPLASLFSYQCGKRSNMAILDVQIPSGCVPEKHTVTRVSWRVCSGWGMLVGRCQEWESGKGHPFCLSLCLRQWKCSTACVRTSLPPLSPLPFVDSSTLHSSHLRERLPSAEETWLVTVQCCTWLKWQERPLVSSSSVRRSLKLRTGSP